MFWENLKARAFTSWQTTATALVAGIIAFLADYGVTVTEGAQQKTVNFVVILGMMLIGLFAKDANKTGAPRQ